MAEDLQYLIDRIQKDAVDKADNQAADIIKAAKDKAATIVKDAESEAQKKLEKADEEAKVFVERSERTIQQAARDVLISVGKNLEGMVLKILSLQVEKGLSEDVVKQMLLTLAKNYNSDIEVAFSEADAKKLMSFVMDEFKKQLTAGVKVESDSGIRYGFRIQLEDGKVSHEFTSEAISEALSALLRPQISKIVSEAAQGK